MNITEVLKDLEKLDENIEVLVNDIESIKNVDEEQAKIIQEVADQLSTIKEDVDSSESVDDLLFEGIYHLTKKIETLVDIQSFEKEVKKIKKVESHLASLIAQSDVVKTLEEAFKANLIEDAEQDAETDKKIADVKGEINTLKNKDKSTDKRIAENAGDIRDLRYKDEETAYKIKDLDNKIEKAKLGNAKVDSEQSKHITKNTETLASLDKKISEANTRINGIISHMSLIDFEIEKHIKVKALPTILMGVLVETIRFGAYFGIAALILKRIIHLM